jgi:hypothetical protein
MISERNRIAIVPSEGQGEAREILVTKNSTWTAYSRSIRESETIPGAPTPKLPTFTPAIQP